MPNIHPYYNNSAYAGFDKSISVSILSRNQWVGLPGSPKFKYIGAHLPVYIWKAGFGADLFTNGEGNLNFNTFRISGNKIFEVAGGLLSVSTRLALKTLNINGANITTPQGTYGSGSIDHKDPILNNENIFGLGLGWELSTWFRKNNYQVGLSLAELPTSKIKVENVRFRQKENINLFFQLYQDITETVQIQPYISLKSDLNYLQTEISGIARINGNIFGGISLRGYSSSSVDALGIMLGHKLNKRYSIYYNYDAGISSLRKTNEGSHEILLRINFLKLPGSGIPPKIIFNPRFLE
jgi:type IX secretion system PorP/SprF family membrane protein